MTQRHITEIVKQSLGDFPAVLINGARQVGKSTLAHQLINFGFAERYVTLDDITTLQAAREDPDSFVRQFGEQRVAIDEIQRVPDLMRALKKTIDEDRRPGRFILTGSANILSYPEVSESLAGRVDIIPLEGLSLGELYNQEDPSPFFNDLFSGSSFQEIARTWTARNQHTISKKDLLKRVLFGGFPEVALKQQERFKDRWFSSYISAYIDKDVRDLTRLVDVTSFNKVFRLASLQTGNLLNIKTLSMEIGLDQRTVNRYLDILAITFQNQLLLPWFSNTRKRLLKTPKIYATDSATACYVMGIHSEEQLEKHPHLGALLETWIFAELRKLLALTTGIEKSFYRTHQGKEVDFVFMKGNHCVAVECKASSQVSRSDFKGMDDLTEALGSEIKGIVMYCGHEIVLFSDTLMAVPYHVLI